MKINFDRCLEYLLRHEGGFVNGHAIGDQGGLTNYGITEKVYKDWLLEVMGADVVITEDIMRNLPMSHVQKIYRSWYWDRLSCDRLPSGIDWMCFDLGVNSGVSRSARFLQKSVGAISDGIIGPQTLSAISSMKVEDVINDMHARRQEFYECLSAFGRFGKGWTRRNNETRDQALALGGVL